MSAFDAFCPGKGGFRVTVTGSVANLGGMKARLLAARDGHLTVAAGSPWGAEVLHLLRSPSGLWYLMCDAGGFPVAGIDPMPSYRLLACRRLRWLALVVAKNGCSSLLASALAAEGLVPREDLEKLENPAWGLCDKDGVRLHDGLIARPGCEAAALAEAASCNWRIFRVTSPETERAVRWADMMVTRWRHYGNLDRLERKAAADTLLWLRDYADGVRSEFFMDEHVIHPALSLARLRRDTDFAGKFEEVPLRSLAEWYGDSFGEPLVRNNVSRRRTVTAVTLGDDWLAAVERRAAETAALAAEITT